MQSSNATRLLRVGGLRETPLSRLSVWPENPRTITPERLEQLKSSLEASRAMLSARPLIALPDGTVIAGNQRLVAAEALGWLTIPTVVVDLEPDEARLWALRDNNAFGEWDEPRLAEILAGLADRGVDVALAGFADRDLDRLLSSLVSEADPDAAPELPAGEPRSRPGEVYELGDHRLICGDCTDPEVLDKVFRGERAGVVWTDPPYGVDYVGKTTRRLRIRNDSDGQVGGLVEAALATLTPFLEESTPYYLCSPGGRQGAAFRAAVERAGWRAHQDLIWVKNAIVLGHLDHHAQHELILYGWSPGAGHPGRGRRAGSRWQGDNRQSSVFFIDRPARSESHPTMKPTGLIARQLLNSSRRDELVVDVFAGSGSTLIACEQIGRRCVAVELDPAYCDVIRDRYGEYTRGR